MTITREKAVSLADAIVAPVLELAQVRIGFDAVDQWKSAIVNRLLAECGESEGENTVEEPTESERDPT
mgnify:CR=1 FL=1